MAIKQSNINLSKPENLYLSRYEFAYQCLKEILPMAPSNVISDIGAYLDIGIKNEKMSSLIQKIGGIRQAFDKSPQSLDVIKWDLDHPAPSQSQNSGVILLLDVFEHLTNPGLALQNIGKILLPNGFLILTAPNPLWSRSRVHSLVKGYPACFTQSDLDINHHVFTPWPHIIEKMLSDEGFVIQKYATLNGKTPFPGRPYNLKYPLRVLSSFIYRLLEKYDQRACGMSYGLIAKKTR